MNVRVLVDTAGKYRDSLHACMIKQQPVVLLALKSAIACEFLTAIGVPQLINTNAV